MASNGIDLTVTPESPPGDAPPVDDGPERPGWAFWRAAGLTTLAGGALRLIDLDRPPTAVFDEVYYAGAEHATGAFDINPPLGKWLIEVGEFFFGHNAFGWRIAAALTGTLSILLVILIAQRLFRSTLLACAAGLLVAVDGLHFVLSRTALLDIFELFFVLAGFGCVVLHRERRSRGVPWWLLAAGVCLGLAAGVKWTAVWFVPVFAVLALVWDVSGRRFFGGTSLWLLAFVALAAGAYLATWTGRLADPAGLLHHHQDILRFWASATGPPHPYQSSPAQWLLLDRAVVFDWSCTEPCGPGSRVSEVLLLGTPLLWWSFLPALVALGWLAVAHADRVAGALAVSALVPSLTQAFDRRPTFLFDALPAEPFLILGVVYTLHVFTRRRRRPALVIGAYVVVVAACFAYFYPVFTGQPLPYTDWQARMWLGQRWI